jgi:hypothetical protein
VYVPAVDTLYQSCIIWYGRVSVRLFYDSRTDIDLVNRARRQRRAGRARTNVVVWLRTVMHAHQMRQPVTKNRIQSGHTLLADHPLLALQTVKYSSKQKHKVYVCNIPRDKGRKELLDSFRSLVRGIEELDITTQKDQGRPGQNRGFCFLEMYNQAVAEEAMGILAAPGVQLCGMCGSQHPVVS